MPNKTKIMRNKIERIKAEHEAWRDREPRISNINLSLGVNVWYNIETDDLVISRNGNEEITLERDRAEMLYNYLRDLFVRR